MASKRPMARRERYSENDQNGRRLYDMTTPGFAITENAEFDHIEKHLPLRSRARAITVLGGIRSIAKGKMIVNVRDSDFRKFGFARDAAGKGLKDLLNIGLIEMTRKGRRGLNTEYRISPRLHGQFNDVEPDTGVGKTRHNNGDNTEKHGTACIEARHGTDDGAEKLRNTKESPFPLEKDKGKGLSSSASPAANAAADEQRAEQERLQRIDEFKGRLERFIIPAAKRIGMPTVIFIGKAGSEETANILARAFMREKFDADRLRDWLDERENKRSKTNREASLPAQASSDQVDNIGLPEHSELKIGQQSATATPGSAFAKFTRSEPHSENGCRRSSAAALASSKTAPTKDGPLSSAETHGPIQRDQAIEQCNALSVVNTSSRSALAAALAIANHELSLKLGSLALVDVLAEAWLSGNLSIDVIRSQLSIGAP